MCNGKILNASCTAQSWNICANIIAELTSANCEPRSKIPVAMVVLEDRTYTSYRVIAEAYIAAERMLNRDLLQLKTRRCPSLLTIIHIFAK